MNNSETLANILDAMRAGVVPPHRRDEELLAYLANRLEAALKREPQPPNGNAAALREALEAMCRASTDVFRHFAGSQSSSLKALGEAFDRAESALAAPARNCDIGTPEEQRKRYIFFCEKHYYKHYCEGCPACRPNVPCKFVWAQLPYEP